MNKHYHFVGIGGIGMSGLAHILLAKGQTVSGSDLIHSHHLDHLKQKGASIFLGHDKKWVKRCDFVIYSTDIPKENVELVRARKLKIPILHRSDLLAKLLCGYAPLVVTGTHGKTTTASLLAHQLVEAKMDPSFAIGGVLANLGANSRHGQGTYFAVEADESDGSFLKYPTFGAILTNVGKEHMNYWKDEKTLLDAFETFAHNVGSKDHLFWCFDDPALRRLKLPGHSYGFDERSDLRIERFLQKGWELYFDLSFKGKKYLDLKLPLIGAHNVLNASAAFGLGRKLDISENVLRASLATFAGIGRRCEKKGEAKGVEIYDDYAHHPTEIFATLHALRTACPSKRIIVLFQPHRYSRTLHCLSQFSKAFSQADLVIVTDIFCAKEDPIDGITKEKIADEIDKGERKKSKVIGFEKLVPTLCQSLKEGDLLITMGAGNITRIGPQILKEWGL